MFIPLFLLTLLTFFVSSVHATTYWVSTTGGTTVCASIDGDADPGAYATPAQLITAGCMSAGDTVMFKAGTYTTGINWSALLISGTSSGYTTALCEGDQTCTIKSNSWANGTWGVITMGWTTNYVARSYIQIGARGNGFTVDGTNCSAHQCKGIMFLAGGSSSNQTGYKVIGNHVLNVWSDGITTSRNGNTLIAPTDVLIEYNTVDATQSPNYSGQGPPHGIYTHTNGAIIQHNDVTSPGTETSGSGSLGIQCYLPCSNSQILRNIVRVIADNAGIIIAGGSSNSVAAFNVVKATGSLVDSCLVTGNGSGTKYYNNVCHGFSTFISTSTNANTTVDTKNNVCITGFSCTVSVTIGSVINQSGNSTGVATSNFKNVATLDYSLVAGSSLIDAGVATTFACNGTCDKGAFETFTFSSCSVESSGTSNILVTFISDANSPLLPASGATTFTARRNGSNNALTGAVTVVGDSIFSIPVTTAYSAGNTVDISLASPNITDSTMVGGTINQPYLGTLSNQSCTNNAAGPGAYTYTQAAFEFHYPLGSESSPVILPYGFASTGAAENFVNLNIRKGGKIRIRFAVVCGGADCPDTAFLLFRSTGGAYTQLSDSFGANGGFKFCGVQDAAEPSNGSATTNQLSTSGTFAGGGIIYTSNAIPYVTSFSNGKKAENEYCVEVRDTAAGFADFRLYTQTGVALDTYTVTPRIVIVNTAAGGSGM